MRPTLRWVCAAVVAGLVLPAGSARAGQATAGTAAQQTIAPLPDPEAQDQAAPVLLGGEPVLWITAGAGPYTPQFRADRIGQRLEAAARDRALHDLTVTVTEVDGSSELRVGPRLLMAVTARDAASLGIARASMAQQYARALEAALRTERQRYAPSTLIRSGVYGAIATLVFAVAVWLILRLTRRIGHLLSRRLVARSESLRTIQAGFLADTRIGRAVTGTTRAVRFLLVLVLFDLYLTYVLGLFPWTRALSFRLVQFAIAPVQAVGGAFIGYLPKLLFLIVIGAVVYAANRLVALFFRQIEEGRLVFANFPAEWAPPTYKIARVLLVAFGLVVAFPYLPASESPAFAGVSVFMGVLFSLASSSALSNMIAGIVLTYTGAFRVGDRVKVGDALGDVVETALLATHVRTIKNEEVTIPNSLVLGSSVMNYSRRAGTLGLILHTSVTIGYDAPWRTVHDLLISAALATPRVLPEPRPFVWQTALNDFYVTYEINAYTASPQDMVETYADLHARIQDAFYAAGVEIMSPHYTSIRDGNTVAIPEAQRPRGYQPGAFRVSETTSRAGV